MQHPLRDWSLITERGGGYKTGGGACEVLPLLKWGGGGVKKVLAILTGGHKKFPLFKRGTQKVLPCLEGGGAQKKFGPAIFPFCSPPPRY